MPTENKIGQKTYEMHTKFDGTRIFGSHDYGDGGGDCKCSAYIGNTHPRAPLGIDPFGACPSNLIQIVEKETKGQDVANHSLKEDLESNVQFIILARIHMARIEVSLLKQKLNGADPDKEGLVEENIELKEENNILKLRIERVEKALRE